jgi:hypothetical protein
MILLKLLHLEILQQYATDLTDIEEYLKHIINGCQSSGFVDDQDVTFKKIQLEELNLQFILI